MFCVSVRVKLTVPLFCVYVHSAWKGRLRNDLYCVGRDVKPYSLTHSLIDRFNDLDAGELENQMSGEYAAEDPQTGDEDTDAAKISLPPSETASSKISSRASLRLLPLDVPLPQLNGNPDDMIELDEDDEDGNCWQVGNTGSASGQGVRRLIERLMRHNRRPTATQSHKPKTVEIR